MPRNVTPRCIIDPVQVVPLFAFTAAQREQIIGALPCVSGDQLEFIAGLERCARTFLWLRNQYRERLLNKTPRWPKSVSCRAI